MTFVEPQKRRKKRDPNWIPKEITPGQIEWAANNYMQRYIATEAQLRRVLMRRLQKNWRKRGENVTEDERQRGLDLMGAQIEKVREAGRIQDDQVALMWTEHYVNRGKSAPFIRQKLREKGVDAEIIDRSIQQIHDQMADPALESAITYARKRRFGAYRKTPEQHAERKERDMAAMMRAGHRYEVVRQVLDCTSVDEIEALIEDN